MQRISRTENHSDERTRIQNRNFELFLRWPNRREIAVLLTTLLLGVTGIRGAMAQEASPTDEPGRSSVATVLGEVNLRAGNSVGSERIGVVHQGDILVVEDAPDSEGYDWVRVLTINGVPVEGDVFVAHSGNGSVFLSELQPTAEPVPEAPLPGSSDDDATERATDAPTTGEVERVPTSVPESTPTAILTEVSGIMTEIGLENPHFSGPINHDDLQTWHLDNSTYLLGRFQETNGDYLVSYCAPVAAATQVALEDAGEPLVVANFIVDNYQYNTSTRVMEALGSSDHTTMDLGGTEFDINRWGLSQDDIEDRLDSMEIGDSVMLVMRHVTDRTKVGHLLTVQRNAEDRFTIIQSNQTMGVFFQSAAPTSAANEIGAANGGVFVSIGDLDAVATQVFRTANWYYSTGLAGMTPVVNS